MANAPLPFDNGAIVGPVPLDRGPACSVVSPRSFAGYSARGHDVALASAFSFARRSCARRDQASASSALTGRRRTSQTAKPAAARMTVAIDLLTCDPMRVIARPPQAAQT